MGRGVGRAGIGGKEHKGVRVLDVKAGMYS